MGKENVRKNRKLVSIAEIKDILGPILKKIGVQKAVVFGSYAKNTQSPKSDLDMMIVMETDERYFKRYNRLEEVYHAIKGIEIDILVYTPEELKDISHRAFIKKVLTEGQIIYEC